MDGRADHNGRPDHYGRADHYGRSRLFKTAKLSTIFFFFGKKCLPLTSGKKSRNSTASKLAIYSGYNLYISAEQRYLGSVDSGTDPTFAFLINTSSLINTV